MSIRRIRRSVSVVVASGACFAATGVAAQNAGGEAIEILDVTMELLPADAAGPDAITRRIELPDAVAEAASRNAAAGLERAAAGADGEPPEAAEDGLAIAAEARDRALEQAQEARESAGRGRPDFAGPPDSPGPPDGTPDGPPDGTPDGPPDLPGLPEVPDPGNE